MQEHLGSLHGGQSAEAFSCPLCSLVCAAQLELQEHLLSCHMEAQEEQEEQEVEEEQASTSYTVSRIGTRQRYMLTSYKVEFMGINKNIFKSSCFFISDILKH